MSVLTPPTKKPDESVTEYIKRYRDWQKGLKDSEGNPTQKAKKEWLEELNKENWSNSTEREI